MDPTQIIKIRGAKEKNLKNINLDLPHGKLIMFTGISGSGKTALAIDTILAEGQRRIIESISNKTNEIIQQLPKPNVDHISGLPLTIGIQPRKINNQSLTVGTETKLYDYFRLLFTKIGQKYCPNCNQLIKELTSEQITDKIIKEYHKDRVMILAPVAKSETKIKELMKKIHQLGYVRIRVNGEVKRISDLVFNNKDNNIEVVVDRMIIEHKNYPRLLEAVEQALQLSGGHILITCDSKENGCLNKIIKQVLYSTKNICVECQNKKINKTKPKICDLSIQIQGVNIDEVCKKPIYEIKKWINKIESISCENELEFICDIIKKIRSKIHYLMEAELSYLTLSREMISLSNGELQKINLISQIQSDLTGILYILDEPFGSLCLKDNIELIKILIQLKNKNNTIIVINNDVEILKFADLIVDFGISPGINGGQVTVIDNPDQIASVSSIMNSLRSQREASIPTPLKRRCAGNNYLRIINARCNNLKKITVDIPLGLFVCITGVTGAGKSSLINTLKLIKDNKKSKNYCDRIEGSKFINDVIDVSRNKISKKSKKNTAYFLKILSKLQRFYTQIFDSKKQLVVSNNNRCESSSCLCIRCQKKGKNTKSSYSHFNDFQCNKKDLLYTKYRGKSIEDLLDMEIHQAIDFLEKIPQIKLKMIILQRLRLGYIKLGQEINTLSDGEFYRLNLAKQLFNCLNKKYKKNLIIIDNIITKFHANDLGCILEIFHEIVDEGNTVVIADNNLEIIKTADWIIELGPEGGDKGGRIMTSGSSEELINCLISFTVEEYAELRKLKNNKQYILTSNLSSDQFLKCEIQKRIHILDKDYPKLTITKIPNNKKTILCGPGRSSKSILGSFLKNFQISLRDLQVHHFSRYLKFLKSHKIKFKVKQISISNLRPIIQVSNITPRELNDFTVDQLFNFQSYMQEINDEISKVFCSICKEYLNVYNIDEIVKKIINLPKGTKIYIMSPVNINNNQKLYDTIWAKIRYLGFTKVRMNNIAYSIDDLPDINHQNINKLEIIIDQLIIDINILSRISESVRRALNLSDGILSISYTNFPAYEADWKTEIFSINYICLKCLFRFEDTFQTKLDEPRSYTSLHVKPIIELHEMLLSDLFKYFETLKVNFSDNMNIIEGLRKIQDILNLLISLGLSNLTLSRTVSSLSAGECYRLLLASQTQKYQNNCMYIFDNPSKYIHPYDHKYFFSFLNKIKQFGNTIILIDNEQQIVKNSDYIFKFGLATSQEDENILTHGSIIEILKNNSFFEDKYLKKTNCITNPAFRRSCDESNYIQIVNANTNNLKGFTLNLPLNLFIVVTGISGSGKSSFLRDIVFRYLDQSSNFYAHDEVKQKISRGAEKIDNVVWIDQLSISNSVNSTIASISGIMNQICEIFSSLPESQIRGYCVHSFSLTKPGGRCIVCRGTGQTISNHPSIAFKIKCPSCKGLRYQSKILAVKLKSKSIADILEMNIQDALLFFDKFSTIIKSLQPIQDIGLGYLTLGQFSRTLTDSEIYRLKLAIAISNVPLGKNMYLIDNPTSGMYYDDVKSIVNFLQRYVDKGNTVICIEHNLDVIKCADWIIDLGPGSGFEGGNLVFSGSPQDICNIIESKTGAALRSYFQDQQQDN